MDSHGAILQWLRLARKHGRALLLLFDYDGTLVPIAEHPDLAVLTPRTRSVLLSLAQRPGVRLGVISGRALADLKQKVQIPGIDYAGTDGIELELGGVPQQHPDAGRVVAQLAEVKEHLQQVITPFAGAWIEAKPLGLTVHFRQVAEELVGGLQASLQRALESPAGGLRVLPGPRALEVLPDLGWSKGTAVRMMIEHAAEPAIAPCYFGDQANDASAFDAVADLGGIAVGIGESAPGSARFRLESPAALDSLLVNFLAVDHQDRDQATDSG